MMLMNTFEINLKKDTWMWYDQIGLFNVWNQIRFVIENFDFDSVFGEKIAL